MNQLKKVTIIKIKRQDKIIMKNTQSPEPHINQLPDTC